MSEMTERPGTTSRTMRREWTLADLLTIFQRRRAFVLSSMLAALALAAIYCLTATPRYLATGQIEVDSQEAGTLGLDQSVTGGAANNNSDALATSMILQTDARILQSSTLALIVIKELHLETTADYFPPHRAGLWIPAWVFFWRKPLEPMSVPLDNAPNRRYAALEIFAHHLKIAPVAGTRLIDVSYANPDPKLAAEVVNRLIAALEAYTFQSRFQATSQASEWLTGQLAGLKKQTENLEQTADTLEQGTGVYGGDAAHNLVLARLDGLNRALERAESNRILKQSIYEIAKSGDPEKIASLAGDVVGAGPEMNNSLSLLQALRDERAKVQATIDEDNERYGSAYPMMAELHGKLDGLNKSIQREIRRIGERARTDYEVAQKSEDAARTALQKQEQLATADNSRMAAYELARQNADASRNLYQGLLNKLKEAGVLEGLHSTNLTVVNAGLEPPTNHPYSPNVPLIFAAALALGLFAGCAGALVREAADRSVRSIDDLEYALGVPLAGVFAQHRTARRFVRKAQRGASLPVGLRGAFALPRSGTQSTTVLITSAASGDGKSRLAVSLALTLSRGGARVLLVDADLERPSLHTRLFDEDASPKGAGSGLAEALRTSGPITAHPCVQSPGLWLVPAGNADPEASHAADLLASPRMSALMDEWRSQYDVVLVDTAPALAVPNAAALARLCERTLLVVRYQRTAMRAVERSYRIIRRNLPEHAELDVVMNGVPENSPDYAAYYGHKGARA